MEQAIPIRIIKKGKIEGRTASFVICSYGEAERTITVVVTEADFVFLRNKYSADLEEIAKETVRWAFGNGIAEGEVNTKDAWLYVVKELERRRKG